ncbi:MAG: hypothetical protein ACREGI_05830 [Candidatus Levyibacteriota bacterium]
MYNPWSNTSIAGPSFSAATVGRGSLVIPRADGTFLITFGQNAGGVASTTTNIYLPWGSTFGVGAGIGTMVAGPTMNDAVGAGAVAFWRPDGKFVIINGSQTGSSTVDTYDAGWYADGQYLSGQNNVSQLSSNSTLTWSQTADKYVGVQVRTAASQAALNTTNYHSIANSGGNLNITPGDTWIQVQINMGRDFPMYASIPAGSDSYTVSEGGAHVYPTISMPTLNWYKISNDSDVLTLQSGGSNVFRVTSTGNVYVGDNGGYYTSGADLAENYTSTQDLQPGEVVTNDASTDRSVMRSVGQYQSNLLGVVSTDPGFVAGAYTTDSYPIALVGRVPVKISTENGPIHAGDYLTSASIPGYAMKATVAGQVIGKAMEDMNPTNLSACPAQDLGALPATQCGSVMMFMNLTNWLGESVQVAMADQVGSQVLQSTAADGITQGNAQTIVASQVIPLADSKVLAFLESQNNSAYHSDVYADSVAASSVVITPKLVANLIYAKVIKADQIIGLEVFTNKISQLSDDIASLSAQAQFASNSALLTGSDQTVLGVSTSSGQLNVDGLAINGLATVSADLRVQGNGFFEGMLTVLDTIMTPNLLVNKTADFFGIVIFHGDVSFEGHPTFGKDSAGMVVVKKDTNNVAVVFVNEYATTPFITANITFDDSSATQSGTVLDQSIFNNDIRYVITRRTTKGFTIQLNKQAPQDIPFSWNAVAVQDAASTGTNFLQQILGTQITPTGMPLVATPVASGSGQ